jgi:hypothetical protein
LAGGVDARELGEFRLKDFDEPVRLFQLGDGTFPPLKTISNTNLPRPASTFVGRDDELAAVLAVMRSGARVVTLTGPGGAGKTRLAIEAAGEVVGDYPAGVFWVGLAPLRDPALVLETISHTLGSRDELALHIGARRMLLLLDNLEQVIEAASQLVGLLEACPNLDLLCTSRERLHISGERTVPVLPLRPADAVELFSARAQVETDVAVARICERLDHLPLAIELAAARVPLLPPQRLLERLEQRLPLLTTGTRDAPDRQQTLRAAIEWSHDLLDQEERELFGRMAVFAGGCSLDSTEAVAGADLDTLQSLVEKSLVRQTDARFWMLETIREFATTCGRRVPGSTNAASRTLSFGCCVHLMTSGRSAATCGRHTGTLLPRCPRKRRARPLSEQVPWQMHPTSPETWGSPTWPSGTPRRAWSSSGRPVIRPAWPARCTSSARRGWSGRTTTGR